MLFGALYATIAVAGVAPMPQAVEREPYKLVVVATTAALTETEQSLLAVTDREKLAAETKRTGYRLWVGNDAAVVYGPNFLNAEFLRTKTRAIQVMLETLQSGKKSIALDDLSPEDADVVRNALVSNLWVQPNETPLLFRKGYEFTCVPGATVTLTAGGKSINVPVTPGQFDEQIGLKMVEPADIADPDGKYAKWNAETCSRLRESPVEVISFQYSKSRATAADKAKAASAFMAEYSLEIDKLQKAYVDLCGSMTAAVRSQMGDPIGDSGLTSGAAFSTVKDPAGKAVADRLVGGWSRYGFADQSAAESFLGRAQVKTVKPWFLVYVPGVKPMRSHGAQVGF
jgi:hypothetical protein